jgi:hypothetical protein
MSKRNKKADKVSFWATVPGILTGIAAIITAIGGLTAVLYNTGVFDRKTSPMPTNNNSAPNGSNKASGCFERLFSDIAKDRVSVLEAGAVDVQIVGPQQSKNEIAGIKFTQSNQQIGAMRIRFIASNNMFKVEQIVNSECQEVEASKYRNISRGGDNRVLQNWDELEIELGAHRYVVRLGYGSGRVAASMQKANP